MIKRSSNVKSARASSSESTDKPFGPKASSKKSQSSSPNVSLVKTRKGVLARKRHSVVSDKDASYTKSTTHLRVEAVNTFNRGRNSMGAMRGPSTTKAQHSHRNFVHGS